ncbi:uncharacterized protein [Oscarella lobularis]|uniref:uncharacterized protein n=1 Tax=Oscarella lobularis TaxID=121494 RepID=UPI0033137346
MEPCANNVRSDDQSGFHLIPTWMWALVFVLVALLLLTYASIVVLKITSRARKELRRRKKEKRVVVARRGGSDEDSVALRQYEVYTDCRSSATIDSHLIAVCPGFFKRDCGCQTEPLPAPTSSRAEEEAHLDDVRVDGATSRNAVTGSTSISSLEEGEGERDSIVSDRDVVSQLTATGLYGKAGEPTKLPARMPVFPGFRIIQRANAAGDERTPPVKTSDLFKYSVKEEEGVVFHKIDFAADAVKETNTRTPRRVLSESETGSLFTGASYSDVFGDFESRTDNHPDGASNVSNGSLAGVSTAGNVHSSPPPLPLPSLGHREWYESSSQEPSRQGSENHGDPAKAALLKKKKYVEISC